MPITKLHSFYSNGRTSQCFRICNRCLKTFHTNFDLLHVCKDVSQRETMPDPAILKFRDFDKVSPVTHTMYCDIKAILAKNTDTQGKDMTKAQKHTTIGLGSLIISKSHSPYHEQ